MLKVLLVDDEPFILQGLKLLLDWKAEGYEIYTATNGKEALDFINYSSVDLVIADIKMPVMTGLELLKELRESKHSDKRNSCLESLERFLSLIQKRKQWTRIEPKRKERIWTEILWPSLVESLIRGISNIFLKK